MQHPNRANVLKKSYFESRSAYCGLPITDAHKFDTELVSHVIMSLKQGKALDVDGLSAEHLQFCHPILSVILSKLFNLMMSCSFVSDGFRYSYIVPIPKPKDHCIVNILPAMTLEGSPLVLCCPRFLNIVY